jgi:hypothetical protein
VPIISEIIEGFTSLRCIGYHAPKFFDLLQSSRQHLQPV